MKLKNCLVCGGSESESLTYTTCNLTKVICISCGNSGPGAINAETASIVWNDNQDGNYQEDLFRPLDLSNSVVNSGLEAYLAGNSLSDNPWSKGTLKYESWRRGFLSILLVIGPYDYKE